MVASTALHSKEAIDCKTHAMLKERMRADLRVYRDSVSALEVSSGVGSRKHASWRRSPALPTKLPATGLIGTFCRTGVKCATSDMEPRNDRELKISGIVDRIAAEGRLKL